MKKGGNNRSCLGRKIDPLKIIHTGPSTINARLKILQQDFHYGKTFTTTGLAILTEIGKGGGGF